MNEGYVNLKRTILEWEYYDDIPCKVLLFHLIFKVNFKETKYRGKVVKRGQLVTGKSKLAEQTSLSLQQVKTALTKLEKCGAVSLSSNRRGTLVTLLIYDDLQHKETNSNHQSTANQPTNNRQVTDDQPTSNHIRTKGTKESNEIKGTNIPTEREFIDYLVSSLPKINPDWDKDRSTRAAKARYETYIENNWKDGYNKPIKNWKLKAKNAIKCEKPWSYGSNTISKNSLTTSAQNPNQYR